ncbi:transposase [Mesorhizobium sp. M0808]|uniref:transposase n=1 Tax=Mesorhizobium sp. M0808 TaxID=2957002 RepID=UPI00333A6865
MVSRSGPGSGNASYPAEPLVRCLLLGVWHGLSDPALEAQIRDRLSFRCFAGFSLSDFRTARPPFDIVALP